jgi:hypothetical protein
VVVGAGMTGSIAALIAVRVRRHRTSEAPPTLIGSL